jgi:hypothetical protein
LLCAVEFSLSSPAQIVLASREREEAEAFATELGHHFMPHTIIAFSQPGVTETELPELTPLISGKIAIEGKPTVYICKEYTCKAPITDLEELKRVLSRQR